MLSITSVTSIYLLHILKPSTNLLSQFWSAFEDILGVRIHPEVRNISWTSIIIVKTSKLSYRAHSTLIRKLLTRERYFKCAKIACFWFFQSCSRNRDNCHGYFVFICISQNIENRVLSLSKSRFSFKSFRMSMRWALCDNFEISTLLSPTPWGLRERDQNSKESHHIWSACFWHGRSLYICLLVCTDIKVLFGTLCQCSGRH